MAFTLLTQDFHEAVALLLQQKESLAVKMYVEYSTVSDPTVPSESTVAGTTDHNAYYDALGTTTDFLRIDVAQYPRLVSSGHYQGGEAPPHPIYTNNKITLTGFTSDGGSSGIHNVNVVNGYIYGAALALSDTSVNTTSNDIILARTYFDSTYTQVTATKGASVQITLNLVNSDSCLEFKTATLTWSGLPDNDDILSIADGEEPTVTTDYKFDTSSTDYSGTIVTGGYVMVGTSGATTADDMAGRLTTAINGADGVEMTATDNSSTTTGELTVELHTCSLNDASTDASSTTNLTATIFS